jgi:hypothetical protein
MPTECSTGLFGFPPVEGRDIGAAFHGGAITSDTIGRWLPRRAVLEAGRALTLSPILILARLH